VPAPASSAVPRPDPARREDSFVTRTRREAVIVFCTWIAAMAWSVGYCAAHGYADRAEDLRYVWGFPDWVIWGVIVPWSVCLVFSWIFGAIFMRDADLGQDEPVADGPDENRRES
jgi:hypothetical protein